MKKNYLFLGFAVPDEEINKVFGLDKFPAVQTHNFNWNLIKGIESYDTFAYTYISACPVSDFPYYPHKKIRGGIRHVPVEGKRIEITEIPFVNTSVWKIITRFFSSLFYSLKKYGKVKNKGGVIVYSVHVPFMLAGWIISRLYKIDYIAIWTDPPSVRNVRESSLKSKFRNIEHQISVFLMKKATKVIALTRYLAEDYAPGKPYLVIEGIIDEKNINPDLRKERAEDPGYIKVIYTGSLEKEYGIKNIVEGFGMIEDKNVILEIYGRGGYEEELKKACSFDERIRYRGFLPNREILKVQREADFLINARSAGDEYVKYSFPSKTLEYMLSGTPLITTMLPGIPEEYREYVIVLEDNRPGTIAAVVQKAVTLHKEERKEIGERALAFAKTRNYRTQGKKITEFLL